MYTYKVLDVIPLRRKRWNNYVYHTVKQYIYIYVYITIICVEILLGNLNEAIESETRETIKKIVWLDVSANFLITGIIC